MIVFLIDIDWYAQERSHRAQVLREFRPKVTLRDVYTEKLKNWEKNAIENMKKKKDLALKMCFENVTLQAWFADQYPMEMINNSDIQQSDFRVE